MTKRSFATGKLKIKVYVITSFSPRTAADVKKARNIILLRRRQLARTNVYRLDEV